MSVVTTPIPEGAVLLHVGLPKTGTTALQNAAARRRRALLEHGVLYPGTHHNHSWASFAVARRRRGWGSGPNKAAVPPISHWEDLVAEVRAAETRRVLVSHEYFAEHSATVCERVVRDLDRDVHVVFTMRNQSSLLSSTWQEYLKNGITLDFPQWLEAVLGSDEDPEQFRAFAKRTALSDSVAKWARIVGPERVTVAVLDKDNPSLLTETFESLLDVPRGLLGDVELSGARANRSMTAPEAELVRSMNADLRGHEDVSWDLFRGLYRLGAITSMLSEREPAPDEPRILPPRWAAEAAAARARGHVEAIAGLGVTVVGRLDDLAAVGPSIPEPEPTPDAVPVQAAREATLGTFWSAAKRIGALEEQIAALSAAARPPVPATDGTVRSHVRAGLVATEGIASRALVLALLGRVAVRTKRLLRRGRRA